MVGKQSSSMVSGSSIITGSVCSSDQSFTLYRPRDRIDHTKKDGDIPETSQVFTEEIDIKPVQIKNLARCEIFRGDDVSNTKVKGHDSVSDDECLGSPQAEIMDIKEEWLDTENIDSINLNLLGHKYIHPGNDIDSRPPIRSKEELKDMYPECFSGIGIFKNCKYHIEQNLKVKPVVHLPRKITLSLQPYDIIFKYIPDQEVPISEAPSDKTEIKRLDVTIHYVTTILNHVQVEAIQKPAREDQVLQLLMQQIMQGWPGHIKWVPVVVKPFWKLKR